MFLEYKLREDVIFGKYDALPFCWKLRYYLYLIISTVRVVDGAYEYYHRPWPPPAPVGAWQVLFNEVLFLIWKEEKRDKLRITLTVACNTHHIMYDQYATNSCLLSIGWNIDWALCYNGSTELYHKMFLLFRLIRLTNWCRCMYCFG